MRRDELDRFDQAIATIQSEFPHLRVDVQREHPQVEALARIPRQHGLVFDITIYLQNRDELHLAAGEHFWLEWFPCGRPDVFERFLEALRGVITGRFRILETFVLGRGVKAELQRPTAKDEWATVGTWGTFGTLIPWKRHQRILRNVPGTARDPGSEAARTSDPHASGRNLR